MIKINKTAIFTQSSRAQSQYAHTVCVVRCLPFHPIAVPGIFEVEVTLAQKVWCSFPTMSETIENRILSELEDDDFGFSDGYGLDASAEQRNPAEKKKGRKKQDKPKAKETFLAKCGKCGRTYKTLKGYEGHRKSHKLSGKLTVIGANFIPR